MCEYSKPSTQTKKMPGIKHGYQQSKSLITNQ